MDPNLDNRLKSIETKLSDIEKKITKIRSVQRTANSMRLIYWAFIILLAFGAFYFVQPYVAQIKDLYGFVGGNDLQQIDEFINQFQGQDQ